MKNEEIIKITIDEEEMIKKTLFYLFIHGPHKLWRPIMRHVAYEKERLNKESEALEKDIMQLRAEMLMMYVESNPNASASDIKSHMDAFGLYEVDLGKVEQDNIDE